MVEVEAEGRVPAEGLELQRFEQVKKTRRKNQRSELLKASAVVQAAAQCSGSPAAG